MVYLLRVFTVLLLVLLSSTYYQVGSLGDLSSVTIAIDLSHGQLANGLHYIISLCSNCKWVIIVGNEFDRDYWLLERDYGRLPSNVDVRLGGFTGESLSDVSILIIPAVSDPFIRFNLSSWISWYRGLSDNNVTELSTLGEWIRSGERVIWVAGVGDNIIEYPRITRLGPTCLVSYNPAAKAFGENSILSANAMLKAVGSRVRVDTSSISSPLNPGEAIITSSILGEGMEGLKIVIPNAAPLYILLSNGSRVNPVDYRLEGVNVILEAEGIIIDSYKGDERPYYKLGEKLKAPVLIVESLGDDLVVVSGDTMIGGFLGGVASDCKLFAAQGGLYLERYESAYVNLTGHGPRLVKSMLSYMIRHVGGEVSAQEEPRGTTGRVETTTVNYTASSAETLVGGYEGRREGLNVVIAILIAIITVLLIYLAVKVIRRGIYRLMLIAILLITYIISTPVYSMEKVLVAPSLDVSWVQHSDYSDRLDFPRALCVTDHSIYVIGVKNYETAPWGVVSSQILVEKRDIVRGGLLRVWTREPPFKVEYPIYCFIQGGKLYVIGFSGREPYLFVFDLNLALIHSAPIRGCLGGVAFVNELLYVTCLDYWSNSTKVTVKITDLNLNTIREVSLDFRDEILYGGMIAVDTVTRRVWLEVHRADGGLHRIIVLDDTLNVVKKVDLAMEGYVESILFNGRGETYIVTSNSILKFYSNLDFKITMRSEDVVKWVKRLTGEKDPGFIRFYGGLIIKDYMVLVGELFPGLQQRIDRILVLDLNSSAIVHVRDLGSWSNIGYEISYHEGNVYLAGSKLDGDSFMVYSLSTQGRNVTVVYEDEHVEEVEGREAGTSMNLLTLFILVLIALILLIVIKNRLSRTIS